MADEQRIVRVSPSKIQARVIQGTVTGFDYVELTGHAVEQMAIRGLSDTDVLDTLRQPDEEGLPTEPGRKRVRRNKTTRMAVDVVYQEIGHHIRVITVIKITRRVRPRRSR
jgi:hypothetical protein